MDACGGTLSVISRPYQQFSHRFISSIPSWLLWRLSRQAASRNKLSQLSLNCPIHLIDDKILCCKNAIKKFQLNYNLHFSVTKMNVFFHPTGFWKLSPHSALLLPDTLSCVVNESFFSCYTQPKVKNVPANCFTLCQHRNRISGPSVFLASVSGANLWHDILMQSFKFVPDNTYNTSNCLHESSFTTSIRRPTICQLEEQTADWNTEVSQNFTWVFEALR